MEILKEIKKKIVSKTFEIVFRDLNRDEIEAIKDELRKLNLTYIFRKYGKYYILTIYIE